MAVIAAKSVHYRNMIDNTGFIAACTALLVTEGAVVAGGPDACPPPRSFHPDDHRLLACLAGRVHLRYGSAAGARECRLRAGELAFIPAGCWFSHHESRACRLLNLAWRPEGLDCRLRRCRGGSWEDIRTGFADGRTCPAPIPQAFRLCASVVGGASAALPHACRCLIAVVRDALATGLELRSYRGERPSPRWLQLRECIAAHLAGDLRRERVAALLGVHPNHVSRLCTAQGRRFVDVVTDERLSAACRLLAADGMTIAAIARLCGFGSPHYFHRVFRRHLGCSPGAWRGGRSDASD